MADNVAITAGSGTTVAADEVSDGTLGSVKVQFVKLMDGTLDGTTKAAVGANGLAVDVKAVVPGTSATSLGKAEDAAHSDGDTGVLTLGVRKDSAASTAGSDADYAPFITDATGRLWVRPAPVQVRISVTPTISTTPTYTSGDCLGGLMTFANVVRVSGGSGIIQSITVLDKTQSQRAAMDLMFFDRTVTVAGDNSPVAMSDADMANCLAVIPIGPYNTVWPGTPLNSFSTLLNVGLPFVLNGTDLFVQAVVRATPTYVATTDLVFTVTVLQD